MKKFDEGILKLRKVVEYDFNEFPIFTLFIINLIFITASIGFILNEEYENLLATLIVLITGNILALITSIAVSRKVHWEEIK